MFIVTMMMIKSYVIVSSLVPCSDNLRIVDVQNDQPVQNSYVNGQEVVLQRNAGQPRTVACVSTGRERPNIDIYIQEPGQTEPRKLTSADGVVVSNTQCL